MKTLQPNKDYFLTKNVSTGTDEVYFVTTKDHHPNMVKDVIHTIGRGFETCYMTTDTTLQGVKQLDRKLFVKEEDLALLASEAVGNDYCGLDSDEWDLYRTGFEAGYYTNTKEFTCEDMHKCWIQATRKTLEPQTESGFTSFIENLQHLSLPTSITIDNDIINVKF